MSAWKVPRILIVTDDSKTFGPIAKVLAYRGYELVLVGKELDAIDHFKSHQPDVCIIDYYMQNFDARNFCRKVRGRANGDDVSIILVSSYIGTPGKRLSMMRACKANRFFLKPFDPEKLVKAVEEVSSRRLKGSFGAFAASPEKETGE